jgi:hypothetical protein
MLRGSTTPAAGDMVDWTALGQTLKRLSVQARWVAAILLGGGFLLWLVLFAPRLLVPPASDASLRDVTDAAKRHELRDSRLKLQNDVRTTLLQGVGGLAVLIGAFFTYRQVQTSRRQLEIAQHGQVTERFTRAIDQLGHENLDVRLGGIYTPGAHRQRLSPRPDHRHRGPDSIHPRPRPVAAEPAGPRGLSTVATSMCYGRR